MAIYSINRDQNEESAYRTTFTKQIGEAERLVIVQFRAEWNGDCHIIAPIYEELCRSYAANANFFTIDADEEKQIAAQYRITELPTILFFNRGGTF